MGLELSRQILAVVVGLMLSLCASLSRLFFWYFSLNLQNQFLSSNLHNQFLSSR